MTLEAINDWAKLLGGVTTLLFAWKVPAGVRFVKGWLTQALATAMLVQVKPMLAEMQTSIDDVRKQVFPNGGGSMNDKLARVLSSTERTETNVNLLRGTMRAHQDADLSQARFEADGEGEFVWASHAFLRWCNRGMEQVLGYGWINCVTQLDRDRVRSEWETAVAEQREFSLRFAMRTIDGADFDVDAFAKPIRGQDGTTQHWVGVITRIP